MDKIQWVSFQVIEFRSGHLIFHFHIIMQNKEIQLGWLSKDFLVSFVAWTLYCILRKILLKSEDADMGMETWPIQRRRKQANFFKKTGIVKMMYPCWIFVEESM